MAIRSRFIVPVLAAAVAAAALWVPVDEAQAAKGDQISLETPLEYFVTQSPGVALLIRIVGFETAFESRVYGPEDKLLLTSRLSDYRLGALHQLIEQESATRQLRVVIQPFSKTSRTRIDIELDQLRATDRESAALIQAYRLVTLGQKSHAPDDFESGRLGIYALHEAANIFRQLGMERQRLWAVWHAGAKTLDTMRDTQTAIESAEFILDISQRAGFDRLTMAGTLLRGAALSDPSSSLPDQTVATNLSDAHEVLEAGARMAGAEDALYQQAWAINRRGVAYDRAGETRLALDQYLRALELAEPLGDAELANQIRTAAAEASERLGDTQTAVALLGEMNEQLAEAGQDEKLSQSLFEQGRLLVGNFQYPEAVEVLERALDIERSNPGSDMAGPVGILLATAYYHLGRSPRALGLLQDGLRETRGAENRPLVAHGLGVAANIHRLRGEYGLARARRDQQQELVEGPAARAMVQYQRAVDGLGDSLGNGGTGPADRARAFAEARDMARDAGLGDIEALSILQLCAMAGVPGSLRGSCSPGAVREQADRLIGGAVPVLSLEARYLYALYLDSVGSTGDALAQMGALSEDVRFYRAQLPGVLGGWYWESRSALSRRYMAMMLRDPAYRASGSGDGRRSLIALDRLRNQSRGAGYADEAPAREAEDLLELRALIAERQSESDPGAMADQSRRINTMLADLRSRSTLADPVDELGRLLGRLGRDESILTYYFAEDEAHVWIGDRDGVRMMRIPGGRDLAWELTRAGQLFRAGDREDLDRTLDFLGGSLVGAIAGRLKPTVYFIPAGPLSAIPMDALRVGGRYLLDRHEFVNVLSLVHLSESEPDLRLGAGAPFFLAGDPQMSEAGFPGFQGSRDEVRAVADLFIGPDLHMVQGNALTRDEFEDERLAQASVVHLATPARINLGTPGESRIFLSDGRSGPAGEYLTPLEILDWRLGADLVVMSMNEARGNSRDSFTNHIALVTELLDAGAGAVLASLWRNPDAQVAEFMRRFYEQAQGRPPSRSLVDVKREFAAGDRGGTDVDTLRLWSGFQIYR